MHAACTATSSKRSGETQACSRASRVAAGGAKAVSIATFAGKLSWAVHGRSSARSRSATTSSGASTCREI